MKRNANQNNHEKQYMLTFFISQIERRKTLNADILKYFMNF